MHGQQNIKKKTSRLVSSSWRWYLHLSSTDLRSFYWSECIRTRNCECVYHFLGAFAILRKVAISFVISVCPYETTRVSLDRFSRNVISYPKVTPKFVQQIQFSLTSDKNNGCFAW